MRYILTLLFLCLFHSALRAETLVAVGDPWPPYLGPDLREQGLATRIVREALGREGYELKIQFMPWARALRLVRTGDADLLVAAWWTEARAAYLHYSDPYAVNSIRFIKRRDDPFEFEGLESLDNKRIGVVRSYGYGDAFYNADNYQRIENTDFLVNVRMLLAGRIDLTIEDKLVASTILKEKAPQQLDSIAFSITPLITKNLYVATGQDHPRHQQIVAAFNRGLASLKADGSLKRLLKQADR